MNVLRDPYGVFIGILAVVLALVSCTSTKLSSLPTVAPVPRSTSTQAVITAVTVEPLAEAVRITLQASQALPYPTIVQTDSPQLMVDIPGATLGTVPPIIPGDQGIIRSIEAQVLPEHNLTRLIVHLERLATHTIELHQQQLWLTLTAAVEAAPMRVPIEAPSSLATPAIAPAQATATTASVKSSETIVVGVAFEGQGSQSAIVVQTTGTPPQVIVKKLKNPARVLLDVKQAHLHAQQEKTQTIHDPHGIVTTIHAAAVVEDGTPGVKIMAHVRTPVPFEIKQDKNIVRLTLGQTEEASVAPAVLPRTMPVPKKLATLPTPAMMFPALSQAPVVIAPPAGIVAQATPVPAAASAIRSPTSSTSPVKSGGRTTTSGPRVLASGAPGPISVTETLVFSGQKISLDFQEADINDILRLIAEVSGVNIIAGGDVQGKVTTRMVDVPWDQALDVVLKINGLDQEREGNIIRVAPLERFANERQERLKNAKIEAEVEPTLTRVVPINYAPAADIKGNLEKLLSNRGTIFVDARTNTAIITDIQKNLDDALALINTLDRATPQVMIEGRIVESSRNFLRDLGVQIGLASSTTTDRTFPNTIDVRGGRIPLIPTAGALQPPPANFLLDLPAAVTAGAGGAIGFSLASIGGSVLDVQLSALESSGRGKIISSPKIATLDNTEAQIQSGLRIPYETTSAEGTKTEFVDASISLKVTPHVTPNDFIGMKITATKNEADFGRTSSGGAPTISTREATTEMLVRDGDTVVIGGLYRRNMTSTRDGVPFLSKVPIFGWLFQKTRETDDADELLIFITPRIIRQQEEATGKRRGLSY